MNKAIFNLRLVYPERENEETIELYNVYDLKGYFFVNAEETAAYFNFNCPDKEGNLCINEGIARQTSPGVLTGNHPAQDVSHFEIKKQPDGIWIGTWIQDGRESTFSIKPQKAKGKKADRRANPKSPFESERLH